MQEDILRRDDPNRKSSDTYVFNMNLWSVRLIVFHEVLGYEQFIEDLL